jgi:hypothetical protein
MSPTQRKDHDDELVLVSVVAWTRRQRTADLVNTLRTQARVAH